MKTTYTRLALCALLVVLFHSSQSLGQLVTSYGVKGGITRSWQVQKYPALDYTLETRTGWDIGVYAVWFDHPWVQLDSEVHLVRKPTGYPAIPITTAESPDGTGEFATISYQFDFVSVSLMPKISVPIGPFEVYGLVGPRVDFAIHRAVSIGAPAPIQASIQQSFSDHLKHFKDAEIGGDFALGVEFPGVLFSGVGCEARYSPDFTSAYDNFGTTLMNHSWEFLVTIGL